MPLVVEILLFDADESAAAALRNATGHYAEQLRDQMYRLTGEGIMYELQRQISDPESPLRSRSAIGVIVSQGASLRTLGHQKAVPPHVGDKADDDAEPPDGVVVLAEALPSTIGSDIGKHASPPVTKIMSPTKSLTSSPTAAVDAVPRISNFPGAWSNLSFSWWAKCAPGALASRCTNQRIHAAAMCDTHCSPELQSCAQQSLGVTNNDLASVHEIGPCEWPLCVPRVYAAFVSQPPKTLQLQVTSALQIMASVPDGLSDPNGGAAQKPQMPLIDMRFHSTAIELDDAELVVVLRSRSVALTDDMSDSGLPSWLNSTRIRVSRASVVSVLPWPALAVKVRWSAGVEEPLDFNRFQHYVKIDCTPHGAPDALWLFLALPSSALVRRFHEALSTTPRPITRVPETAALRDAVRCELQLLAPIDSSEEAVENCSAAIHRAVIDAVGIRPNRVQVLSIKFGGGTIIGWAQMHISGITNALRPDRAYLDT